MRKSFSVVCCFVFVSVLCFAQISTDPNDKFYQDAVRWQILGYTDSLPEQHPFPLQLVKRILSDVMKNGNESEKLLASQYEDLFWGKALNIYGRTDSILSAGSDGAFSINLAGGIEGNYLFSDFAGISYKFEEFVTTDRTPIVPLFSSVANDTFDDWAPGIGPFSMYVIGDSTVSIGSSETYLLAGISRVNVGANPYKSILVEASSFHVPYFSYVINRDRWNFTQTLYSLSATTNSGIYSDAYPGQKFLANHSVSFDVTDALTLLYFESSITGNRFDLTYFLPCPYMVVQGFSDFADNLIMGVGARLKADDRFQFYGNLFLDDVDAGEVVKFNLDTKIIGSLDLGVLFVPNFSFLSSVSADFTMVTPWMYSHHDFDVNNRKTGLNGYNYQNYTHRGSNIATQLDPNSYRFSVSTSARPVKDLTVDFGLNLIRHANQNESLSVDEAFSYLSSYDMYRTGGGVFDVFSADGDYYSRLDTYLDSFPFMRQKTKMTVLQGNVSADYTVFSGKNGRLSVSADCMLEYVHNFGIQNDMFPGAASESESVEMKKITDFNEKESMVNSAMETWRNKLTDKFNVFASISVKYSF